MKKYMLNFNLFFFLLLGFGFSFAQLNSAEINTLKQKINSATSKLNSLQSDFTQTKHLDFMENEIKSTGKLYYKSPSKVRWEYKTPNPYYVILNDKKIFVNDNGKKSQQEKSMKYLSEIMLKLAKGSAILDESKFTIKYTKKANDFVANMIPKDKTLKKYIHEIQLTFDGKSYLLDKIKMVEPSLDYTQIEFYNQKQNPEIADSKFSF